jgi:hypothetical protein
MTASVTSGSRSPPFAVGTLVDTDKPTGWVHIEPALPYSIMRLRSIYTIYKRHSEEAVMEMQRIFNELWEEADKQTGA